MKKREKSALQQFFANIYVTIIASFLPFLVRTVLVRYMGIEYAGISNLFAAILQVLNISDFGLTTALTYYLYKAVESEDISTVNMYMGYFRKVFHIVGWIILIVGILAMPLLPILVKGKAYPIGLNIYVIYLAYILQTSMYYLTNIYISVLLSAYLKGHISAVINGTSLLVMYLCQIILIVLYRNYYLFSFALLLSVFVQNVFYYCSKKMFFPWLDFSGAPSETFIKDFRQRMVAMILSKLRNVSRNSFDCIIISVFFGLTMVAEYQNYYQIMLVPCLFSAIIRQAFQHALGNGIASESVESNYGIVKIYIFVNNLVTTVCMTILLLFVQPFMKIWMGEEHLLNYDIVIGIVIYYCVLCVADEIAMLREVTGIWKEGMWISVFEAVANIFLNILFARMMGLFGIVLATIFTVCLINIPLESYYVFKGYFIDKFKDFLLKTIKYTIMTGVIVCLSFLICNMISIMYYNGIVLFGIVAIVLPGLMFLIFHISDNEMKSILEIGKRWLYSIKAGK